MEQIELELLLEEYPNRPDVALLVDIISNEDEEHLPYATAKLFWRVYRPVEINQIAQEIEAESVEDPAGPLPREQEEQVLDCLKSLYERHRIPYHPDGDDVGSKEMLDKLTAFAHIAAARALRIKQSEGISEEAVDCLREVESAVARVKLFVRKGVGNRPRSGAGPLAVHEAPLTYVSTGAVTALAFLELARWSRYTGDYTSALHYLAKAPDYHEEAVSTTYEEIGERFREEEVSLTESEKAEMDLLILLDDNLLGNMREHLSKPKGSGIRFVPKRRPCLPISFREAADFLDILKAKTRSEVNWTQTVSDCRVLAYAECVGRIDARSYSPHVLEWAVDNDWGDFYINHYRGKTFVDEFDDELIEGEDGHLVTWAEYWQRAHEWARAQLSPSEYRKLREADERDAAERRLKSYFFGENWGALPSRARQSLISVDSTWNSSQRVRRESIINELLRATEEMCYEFIWKPLSESRESSLEFLKFEARATDRHSTPSSRHYVDLCKQKFLHNHLRRQKLAEEEFRLLTVILPNLLEQLIDRRNPAEHETGITTAEDVIDDCYRRFLGIGQAGLLPELSRISSKLRSGQRRAG